MSLAAKHPEFSGTPTYATAFLQRSETKQHLVVGGQKGIQLEDGRSDSACPNAPPKVKKM